MNRKSLKYIQGFFSTTSCNDRRYVIRLELIQAADNLITLCATSHTSFKSQDKALGERSITLLFQRIYFPLSKQTFLSLEKVNASIAENWVSRMIFCTVMEAKEEDSS